MRSQHALVRGSLIVVALLLSAARTDAQELELRTYSNAPRGVNFIAAGYSYSQGNVLLDPSLPLRDVDAKVHSGFVRYARTFGMLGKAAKLKVALPFSDGRWEGVFQGVDRERETSGLGDMRVTLEVNFSGAPALSPRDFAGYEQKTIVGASLAVSAPTGSYDEDRLINLGSNRWGIRGEVGVSRALGHFIVEGAGEIWYFTDNDELLGTTLSQDPLYAVKADAIYSFRRGFWVGMVLGFGKGAQTEVDGVPSDTEQKNWRFGLAGSYPLSRRQGLSALVQTADSQGVGGEFDQLVLSYQFAWGY